MSRTERGYARGWVWSVFHRCLPRPAYMIDMDYLECCPYCKMPILIGEVAKDVGQSFKPTTILNHAAAKLRIPGCLIFLNEEPIVKIVKQIKGVPDEEDIISVPKLSKAQLDELWHYLSNMETPIIRIKRIFPIDGASEKNITAIEFYKYLSQYHERHEGKCLIYQGSVPSLLKGDKDHA